MKKSLLHLILLFAAVNLTACSSNPLEQFMPSSHNKAKTSASSEEATATGSVGGSLEGSMDEIDKSKMLHALDKSPGTSTHWVNANTGISYTVVPTQKVVINGNPYCRKYTTTASKNNKEKEFGGTACVGADGNWKSI